MSQKIIDFHTHVFPEDIAQKATDAVGNYYGIPMQSVGTATKLLSESGELNMQGYVIHSSATKPAQVENINTFIAEYVKANPLIIGFGTIHKDYENAIGEIDRMKALGLKGIKLHPDFQNFNIDDPNMYAIYEYASDLKIPVLFHVGDNNSNASSPERLSRVLEQFPRLIVIAAHMGGYSRWDSAMDCLYGKNLYFDTSSTMIVLPYPKVRNMIYKHGVDKILFGSDFPLQTTPTAAEDIYKLNLPPEHMDMIFYQNASNLLGI